MAPGGVKRSCGAAAGNGWSPADLALLQQALTAVRPSAPGFWQRVAVRVGRPADQCRDKAFHGRAAQLDVCADDAADLLPPASKRSRGPPAAGGLHPEGEGANAAAPPCIGVLPKSHGPRRARMIQEFLTQRSYCSGHDFFNLRANELKVDVHDLLVSPVGRTTSPVAVVRPMARLPAELDKAEQAESDFDLCDHTFEPKGIEGFICKVQSGYGKRRSMKALCTGSATSWMVKRLRRNDMVRAESLFRKIDCQAGMGDLEDSMLWQAGPDFEEADDADPIASIPC